MNVTIVGGGFGGIKAALELSSDHSIQITLISDRPDFQYYPALYSSATGHSHLESWVPLSTIFADKKNIRVVLDTVTAIDPTTKELKTKSGKTYAYERCILALGVVTTYFGIEGLETYSFGIKSQEEIERLKKHLYTDITEKHDMDKHYVVIGAGPTGVELSAALGSYITRICERSDVNCQRPPQIDLLEAAPRILPRMSEKSSEIVLKRLQSLGVAVHTSEVVESATAEQVMVGGESIKSRTVIWTAGVTNHPFYKEQGKVFNLEKNGRVKVDEYMLAAPDIYVIGDNASTPYTGLAQTALHDALFVAKNIKREVNGHEIKKYKAVKPPVVVPVGENWAILEWHSIRISGWLGSILRRIADFIGYNDMLPLGQALGVWRASMVMEDDYTPPSDKK